ncbi:MAG TPA: translocation/assembly module TamB domain-containing protein, partial [Deinococcales bacterium]|nr:translocation/assembly module TamB domain-containing protein [Deinococcales bacterium]
SGGGRADISLAWSEANGLSGRLTADGFVLFRLPGGSEGIASGSAELADGFLDVAAGLDVDGGELTASGDLSLSRYLPAWLAGPERPGGALDLRVRALELADFPPVARRAPGLAGTVTAAVHIRDDVIAGNVVAADLRAGATPLPVEAVLSGGPGRIELSGSMAGSPLTARLEAGAVSGLLELRRFPLQTVAEALAGPLDATADVTGVLRYRVPLGNPADSDVRLATEQVLLERDGVTSSGKLSLELSSGVFEVHEASFNGAGSWEASGAVRSDLLDFRLEARDADFGLLLGLIPGLNRLGITAHGSVSLETGGSLAEPQVSLASSGVDFGLAGISYRLEDLDVRLRQSNLTAAAELSAVEPFTGRLSLDGNATVTGAPFGLSDAVFNLDGTALLPFIGRVENIRGAFRSGDGDTEAALVADVRASLGQEVRLTGSVWPLDLRLSGSNLQLSLPAVLLADSRLDLDVSLREDDGLVLGGDVHIHEGLLRLGSAGSGDAALSGALGDAVRFDGLHVRAPSRLRLTESFMNVELAADLRIGGTLGSPALSGQAEALRGTFQFSGRNFELRSATARFDPTRGLYPEISLDAVASFDRNRLLPASSSLQLVGPGDGPAT